MPRHKQPSSSRHGSRGSSGSSSRRVSGSSGGSSGKVLSVSELLAAAADVPATAAEARKLLGKLQAVLEKEIRLQVSTQFWVGLVCLLVLRL
jgi:hypothetical protein